MTQDIDQPAKLEDEVYKEYFNQAVGYHINGDVPKAISIYQTLLNRLPHEQRILLNLADALLRMDLNGVAANLLISILSRNPECVSAWVHLGLAYRKENLFELSEEAYNRCLALPDGKTVEAYSGMASLFSDSCEPDKCLIYADKALAINRGLPEDGATYSGYWEKSLALLTKREWEEGFDLYEYRKRLPQWDSRETIIGKNWENTTVEDRKNAKSIYIHGEQGVGDEIMFASALAPLLIDTYPNIKDVTIEVNPKCVGLFQLNFPHAKVIHKAPTTPLYVDIKVAMGTLLAPSYFPWGRTAYLTSINWAIYDLYKEELHRLGPPPYIGIAWIGGAKTTRAEFRSIPLELFDPIRKLGTCISLQYENNPGVGQLREHHKLVSLGPLSVGGDLLHQAMTLMLCNMVVTCQQTLVHMCGATGTNCFVMLPSNPHWRYGVEGESMPWYGDNLVLLRKNKGESWKSLFERTHDRIADKVKGAPYERTA